jgi:DNA-binding NtrC family response regulator
VIASTKFSEEISRFPIYVPPLSQRLDDLPELVNAPSCRFASSKNTPTPRVTRHAIAALKSFSWRRNISELAIVVEKLVVFSCTGVISRRDVHAVLDELPSAIKILRQQGEAQMKQELIELLRSTGGNFAEAARRTRMSRGAIIYRAKKFGLIPESR